MNSTKWQEIEELFYAASELPPEKRASFLDSACPNEELRNELESLLSCSDNEDGILANPSLTLGLAILDQDQKQIHPGDRIGRYRIISKIGEGGMGHVYLAEDIELKRPVALKVLPDYLIANPESIARFEKEALAASSISHPNIAHIYEAGFAQDRRYIAMEYVEGKTLRQLMSEKRIDLIRSLDIIWQIANALTSAHRAGIIHRDIKPENIIVRHDGYIKILDFGIAKLLEGEPDQKFQAKNSGRKPKKFENSHTNPGLILGTMDYISPEQLKNKRIDLRADIWSLGVVFYEILSGRKPFPGNKAEVVGLAILKKTPSIPEFPDLAPEAAAQLQKILIKSLEKKTAKRYQSTEELANELKELKQHLEFTHHYSTGEIKNNLSSEVQSGLENWIQNSSFFTRTKYFWNNQSLSRKVIFLAAAIGFMTFAIGMSSQYYGLSFLGDWKNKIAISFTSPENLRFSTLFGVRRKSENNIPSVSFSPDGNSIAFNLYSQGVDNIYVKNIHGSEPVKITDGIGKFQTPVWAPDGGQIAFVTNRDGKNAIWTVPAIGGDPVFLTNLSISTSYCELLKWSNDSRKIYFKSGSRLKTIEVETGIINQINFPLEDLTGAFSISQDESLIAFVSQEQNLQQILIFNIKNGDLSEVTEKVPFRFFPAFLPDNQNLIFSSNQNGNFQLYNIDLSSKKLTQITFGDANAVNPVVSTDGKRLVYLSQINNANIFSLVIKNNKEERLTEATKLQLFPNVSRDGNDLVYQVTDDLYNQVRSSFRIQDLQTKRESNLENQKGYWARWSPARKEIAYLQHQGKTQGLMKFDLTNQQNTPIKAEDVWTEGTASSPFNLVSSPFDWSPDGTSLTFVLNQTKIQNVFRVNRDGSNLIRLTDNDDPKKRYNSPIWSSRGEKIAFTHNLEIEPNNYLYGVSFLDQGLEREVFQSKLRLKLLGWVAEATKILAALQNKDEVEIYELSEASNPRLLIKLKKAVFFGISLSPDGKTIVYPANRNGIDNIFAYTLNGKERQLTENKDDSVLYSGISWSPSADRIFYSKQTGGLQISMISDRSGSSE